MTARLLTPREVAAELRVSIPTAYRIIHADMLHVFVGRSVRVPATALQRYLDSRIMQPCRVTASTGARTRAPGGAGSTTSAAKSTARAPNAPTAGQRRSSYAGSSVPPPAVKITYPRIKRRSP